MIKLELDYKRLMEYQQLKINLNAVEEHFRVGDILLKEVNSILQSTKNTIDSDGETSFTKEDFDDMLRMRNTVLLPIFQNASFAVEFIPYVVEEPVPIEPVGEPLPEIEELPLEEPVVEVIPEVIPEVVVEIIVEPLIEPVL